MESLVQYPHSISRTCLAQEFGLVFVVVDKNNHKGIRKSGTIKCPTMFPTPCRLTIVQLLVFLQRFEVENNQSITTSQRKGCHLLEGFFLVGISPTGRQAGWQAGDRRRDTKVEISFRAHLSSELFSLPPWTNGIV